MEVQAVTFDLDDTLAVVDRDRATILEEAARSVGAPPLRREDYLAAHAEVEAAHTREPIFEAVLKRAGIGGVDPEALAEAYRRRIGQQLRPVYGAEALLERLGTLMPVGLITNGPERAQWDKLERLGWTDQFDAIVISGRVGAHKPDPIPFKAASDRLGIEPEEILHIGDHPVHDVIGAERAGFEAIQVVERDFRGEVGHSTLVREDLTTELPQLAAPAIH